MPEGKVLSDKGKAALAILRDVGLEEGSVARGEMMVGVCALFKEPLDAKGTQFVSSLAPVARNPRLAIEDFLGGDATLESVLKPHEPVVRTHFGPMEGLPQDKAQQKLRDAITTLKVEIRAQFGAIYDEIVRSSGSRAQG